MTETLRHFDREQNELPALELLRLAAKLSAVVAAEPASTAEASRQFEPEIELPSARPLQLPVPIRDVTPPGRIQRIRRVRRAVGALVLMVLIGGVAAFGYRWWTISRFIISTDDAYVSADNTTVAAKVSGYVASIAVEDNAPVNKGDVIATIDDGDYKLAVEQASHRIETAQATLERIGRQILAQQAAIDQAKAQLAAAEAASTQKQLELSRQQMLWARDITSRQMLEQAQSNRDQAVAGVQSAQAGLAAAEAAVDVLNAQQHEASGNLEELRAVLGKAQRDLSFAVIRAPVDGVIGNRAVQTGDFVQTGQRLASLVPLDSVYVDANFKETQLAHLRPGQKAEISVDALPNHPVEGAIASISPASGSVFSVLPPDNATGNFTKIVQRLAVRIRVPRSLAKQGVLRPGMSVVVSINTKPDADQGAARPNLAKLP
jgi:membrane fusion protein (multidrug efflux system)